MTQIQATALSVLMEAPVALGLVYGLAPQLRRRLPAVVAVAAAATLVTHPFAWALSIQLTPLLGYVPAVFVVEAAVVAVEAAFYRRFLGLGRGHALLVSTLANATSVAGGYLIYWLEGTL